MPPINNSNSTLLSILKNHLNPSSFKLHPFFHLSLLTSPLLEKKPPLMAAPGGYYGYFGHVTDTESDSNNHLAVDELFDFPKEDETLTDAFFDNVVGNSNDSSTVTAVDSCNSSVSGADHFFSGHFSGELCVPYDDLAELEWLSNFVEDSFSSEFIPTVQTATSSSPQTPISTIQPNPIPPFFPSGKARSKRSRAAPNDWSSRLLPLSSPPPPLVAPKPVHKKRADTDAHEQTRKCLHCGSDKTPQWRTGPMGPKTLCNACGVRHKSGRLVPEYRPAASPTFVSAKHSNSHRKVLELRRQKEMMMQRQHEFMSHGSVLISGTSDDYLIHHNHHRSGPDNYRHMI